MSMCLSTVYNSAQQVLCKNVAAVTEKDGQLIFTDIMGIPTAVTGSSSLDVDLAAVQDALGD